MDGRRQDQLPDDHHQPQDGNRQLSERPAPGRARVKESGLIRPQNFSKWGTDFKSVPKAKLFDGRMISLQYQ